MKINDLAAPMRIEQREIALDLINFYNFMQLLLMFVQRLSQHRIEICCQNRAAELSLTESAKSFISLPDRMMASVLLEELAPHGLRTQKMLDCQRKTFRQLVHIEPVLLSEKIPGVCLHDVLQRIHTSFHPFRICMPPDEPHQLRRCGYARADRTSRP